MTIQMIPAEQVARHLPYARCIPLMREAMTKLSSGATRQLLRGILEVDAGKLFGVMPGSMQGGAFGAKLVSVFTDPAQPGRQSHQGLIVLFDPVSGAPTAVVDAGEVTAIRTAAASAAATDALARADASRLAILGYGEQAWRHVAAIREVRALDRVTVWGRSRQRADAFAAAVRETGLAAEAADSAAEAVREADIICTTTTAGDPILTSEDVRDGMHINAVGSSRAVEAEIAAPLVARARVFADHRDGVLAQGGEFLRARAAGLVTDDHLLGEIGEVFLGTLEGRRNASDVTLYKSLGSIVQDLAAAQAIAQAVAAEV